MKYCFFQILILLILFSGGCSDSASGPPDAGGDDIGEPGSPGPSCKAVFAQSDIRMAHQYALEVRRDAEMLQHRISDGLPEFGGAYLDGNQDLVVTLTDRSKENLFHSIVTDRSAMKAMPSDSRVLFHDADFTFQELAAWRELATAFLLSGYEFDFVLSTQVYEKANRIAIGIDQNQWSDENLSRVKDFITNSLEIPEEALLFEPEYPEQDELFGSLQGDTFDRQRPLVGGLRVRYGSSNCTMGFLGLYNDEEVFVTNGHCTDNPHDLSYTLYSQGDREEVADVVGTEMADGPQTLDMCVTMNSDCWPCRWSDSAIVGIRENVEAARGYIAKTEWNSENWMVEGSRQIDMADPVFTIVDIETELLSGMELHKVGGSSGWTSGEVTRTCVDSRRSSHELILQCQYRARYATSGGGTSGSPVFIKIDSENTDIQNPVALAGIHRASSNRDQPNGYSSFSPVSGVVQDFEGLSGLTVEDHESN